jgi:predicted alpha/beta hydrolase
MSAWDDYLAAAVQLDEVRHDSAEVIAAQQAAADAAATQLTGIRQRIALQRARLAEVASGVARAAPQLEPLAEERSAAVGTLAPTGAHSAVDVDSALRAARATLDAADAVLLSTTSGSSRSGLLAGRPPGIRAMVVYGWFALLALVALIEINAIAGGSIQAGIVVLGCALVIPAGAWVLGWLCLRLLYGRSSEHRAFDAIGGVRAARRRSGATLGALLCAVPAIVGLVLAAV